MKEFTLISGYFGRHSLSVADTYEVKMVRTSPGNVELQVVVDGSPYGKIPLDNVMKAVLRVDPEAAGEAERQIEKLRREVQRLHGMLLDADAEKHLLALDGKTADLRRLIGELADGYELTCADALRKVAAGKSKDVIARVLENGMRRAKTARDRACREKN